ncbi:hypothetical protein SDC9_170165 [bioreactor metagenome]|uniref:Uncharacterized protein n=1 Tax=bioreactor metagenome TaxID=1076179 RepID=A0A645G7B0_9ZZZZ
MDKMVTTDRSRITIASYDDDIKFRICKLNTSRKSKGATMCSMYGIKVHIS